MARRLDKLTREQTALIPVVRDEWIRLGLLAEPADRKAAEEGVAAAYRAAGLEPPRLIIWLSSPLAGAIGTTYLQRLLQVWGQVRGQVWDQVEGQVRGQVRRQVGGQVWDQVWGQVEDQVGGQVRDQVRRQVEGQVRRQVGGQVGGQVWGQVEDQVEGQVEGQVWGQVWDQVGGQVEGQVRRQVGGQVWGQVWGQVEGQVRGQVRRQVGQSLWGQHNAGWLSWLDFWRRCGLRGVELSDGLVAVGRAAGWWWALRGAVVLTERPRYVKLDTSGRLHNPDGPAIVYPDGFAAWAWHGLRVARDLIEQPIRLEQIKAERNTELRRMLTERYGQERWLKDGGAVLVSQDDWGKLWRLDQPGDEPLVMVEMVNSTPEPDGEFKVYYERVPPDTRTPVEGLAWQAELPVDEYMQIEAQS